MSFELKGGVPAAEQLLSRITLAISAPSLGSVESLITRPVTTSHANLTEEERRQIGIDESLVRVSVGIEGTEDLLQDFEHALGA